MDDNSWRNKIEKTLDTIHCTVVKIENEHGAKLEALFEGQADLKTDVADLKTDVAELKTGQQKIRGEIREVKDSVDLLRPIANDHESRIQALENQEP